MHDELTEDASLPTIQVGAKVRINKPNAPEVHYLTGRVAKALYANRYVVAIDKTFEEWIFHFKELTTVQHELPPVYD